MTGNALLSALEEKLRVELPDCTVRRAFSGKLTRRPEKPVVALGILGEKYADGTGSTELGVWLYAPPETEAQGLFSAVCTAVQALPCAVERVTRGEAKYDGTIGCMVTMCTVSAASGTQENEAVAIGGETFPVGGVSVAVQTETKQYGSVGEADPHTVVPGKTTYTVTLTGFSGGEALLALGSFALTAGGVRYAPCAVKRIEPGRLVLEAGGAERITENEGEEYDGR